MKIDEYKSDEALKKEYWAEVFKLSQFLIIDLNLTKEKAMQWRNDNLPSSLTDSLYELLHSNVWTNQLTRTFMTIVYTKNLQVALRVGAEQMEDDVDVPILRIVCLAAMLYDIVETIETQLSNHPNSDANL